MSAQRSRGRYPEAVRMIQRASTLSANSSTGPTVPPGVADVADEVGPRLRAAAGLLDYVVAGRLDTAAACRAAEAHMAYAARMLGVIGAAA